jgi:hypothetical protein
MSTGCSLVAGLLATLLGTPAPQAGAAPTAAALYREAMATTRAWTVHYVSTSNNITVPFFESGDAGPASGTQMIHVGKGARLTDASLIVIGDLTYVKGNVLAMEDLTGLSPAEAARATGHWVMFSSDNAAFSQVVVGVRSRDVAQEVALKGPYTMGPSRVLRGHEVIALRGTQSPLGAPRTHDVLYVRASGRHLLVEEDTVGAQGKPNGAEHIVFSKWGERVRPRAPDAALTIGPVSAT